MRNTRHFIAITLVATALCADRVASGLPALQPPVIQFAGRLAGRLSGGIKEVAPVARLYRSPGRQPRPMVLVAPVVCDAVVHPQNLSPLFFRLPPPLV